ncbi:MAG: hypothetical protein DMG38_18005 [Acidobacteria bacterium]|nr:MAG: hypothetical protein DMG38_18005 [Acidobacteriota bacterium]
MNFKGTKTKKKNRKSGKTLLSLDLGLCYVLTSVGKEVFVVVARVFSPSRSTNRSLLRKVQRARELMIPHLLHSASTHPSGT